MKQTWYSFLYYTFTNQCARKWQQFWFALFIFFFFDRTYVVSYCGRDKLAKIGRDHNQKWPKSQSQPVHNDHFLPPDLTGQSAPVRYVVHCTALAPNVFFDHFLGWQRRQDNTWRKYEATVWRFESGWIWIYFYIPLPRLYSPRRGWNLQTISGRIGLLKLPRDV